MTRAPDYPLVERRRVSQLRQALLRDIASLAPDWRGAQEAQGPDRAVVEIAARLVEEATKRLNKTPERDALAFLESFNIAPPRPSAAEGVSVFALKKDKIAPVLARARTGIEIETLEGEKENFETAEDLRIQPARIELLATVDPAADKLELAPAQVTSLEPDLTPRPPYALATSAGPEDTVLSITPPVGILPEDLLRVTVRDGDPVFLEVAAFSEDGLATLKASVGGTGLSVEQVTAIERMIRLDAFEMPNRQEHGLYIGDKDVLNVKEPAEITLRFIRPGSIPEILSPNAVEFEIWGTREGPGKPEEAPSWHRLVPLASAGSDLRLYKAWIGPVDELKVGGEEASRWIRIRPVGDITPDEGGSHPLTGLSAMLDQVRLGIETDKPEDASGDTVSQVAYNGTPLPLTTAFLPFGPEPQRFDTFALAAPEAFTKPGAKATLNFRLTDASPAALIATFRLDDERHAYGIGRNGRLQAMALTKERTLWREVGGPPEQEASDATLALDASAGLAAYAQLDATSAADEAVDIVVAATTGGNLVSARVKILRDTQASAEESVTVAAWYALPDLPEGTLGEQDRLALAAAPFKIGQSHNYRGLLLVAARGGVNCLRLGFDGNTFPNAEWQRIPADEGEPGPVFSEQPFLQVVDGSVEANYAAFIAVDREQALWVLRIKLDGSNAQWFALKDKNDDAIELKSNARPTAIRIVEGGAKRLLVVFPEESHELHLWDFAEESDGYTDNENTSTVAIGELPVGAILRFVPGLRPGSDLPHVLGYANQPETGLVFEWSPEAGEVSTHVPAPDMALSDPPALSSAAIFAPTSDEKRARLVFGVEDQRLVSVHINPSAQVADLSDWIDVPAPAASQKELTEVLVVRKDTDHDTRVISTGQLSGKDPNGKEIYAFDAGTTDWTEDVVAYRASAKVSATYTLDTSRCPTLVSASGTAPSSLVGKKIAVRLVTDPRIHEILTVAHTNNDDTLTVTDPATLVALMGEETDATWQIVEDATTLPGGAPETPNALTLVTLANVTTTPKMLGFFYRAAEASPLTPLTATGGLTRVIASAWPGDFPAVDDLLKIVPPNAMAEVLTAHSLSSKFFEPELSWEYFNGEGWKRLDKDFRDTTSGFLRSGTVHFTVPHDLASPEIGGQEDYWIRARLVGGDYGKPVYKVITTGTEQKVVVDTSDLRPPEVAGVTAQFKLLPEHLPERVVARNNMRDLDQSSANRLLGAGFAMFDGAFAAPLGADGGRAIMLGMTRPLEPGSANLFVQVREQDGEAKLVLETLGPDNSWAPAPLSDRDPTKGLYRSGLLRFKVTQRATQVLLFGKALHWLRMRVEAASDWKPQITGLWLNGVGIVQAETIRQELLASSAGEPKLKLTLLKPPVLANSLELRVRERLSDEEVTALNDTREEGAPKPVLEEVPNLPGKWVLWKQVDSLQDQGGDARVYLLNPDGRLRFGDGQAGRIVPAGRDNIRAFSYQSGGQRVETRAFAEAGLRGSVEGVEMVLAPAPIAGGTHPPKPHELVARMPEVMRHADHGLSLSDLEALARDADSEIVQVRAFAPETSGGPVSLIVLARGAKENRKPEYSLARQDNLRRILKSKMSDAHGSDCLKVRSAAFVEVKVTVNLVARPSALAALETDANEKLRTFLHAALGGPDGNGWPPGRGLWPTDIRRALSRLETLDRVLNVEIVMPEGRSLADVRPHEVITTAKAEDVKILVQGEGAA